MEKKTGKNDITVVLAILAVALVVYGIFYLYQRQNTHEAVAVVTVDGKEYGRYPLSKSVTEKIQLPDGDYNMLEICAGKADVTKASCPDRICVNHRPISKNGQTIVCLPNELVVEIQNGEEAEVDITTH